MIALGSAAHEVPRSGTLNHVSRMMLIGVLALFCHTRADAVHRATCEGDGRWETLIRTHLARYPHMRVADLYKLLHQATMGSEHAVPNSRVAEQWLARELDNLPEGPPEPLVDTLGAGGHFARIHLRPYRESARPRARLLEAFVRTASGSYGDRSALECAVAVAGALIKQGKLPWTGSDVAAYLASREAEGFPSVHHSDEFERHYAPAYRVVAVELVSQAVGK